MILLHYLVFVALVGSNPCLAGFSVWAEEGRPRRDTWIGGRALYMALLENGKTKKGNGGYSPGAGIFLHVVQKASAARLTTS